jgi:hypothetical protein
MRTIRGLSLAGILALGVATLGLSLAGGMVGQVSPATATLTRLAGLAGEWQGTFTWSGARTGTGSVKATYLVTAHGSAVIENLVMGGDTEPSMTSVYHLDGPDLRMTHFCGAGNQPRLKASHIDEAQGIVQFSFVDATNLVVQPAHVDAVEIRFVFADQLVVRFSFVGGGKTSIEHLELQRAHKG